MAAPSGAGKSRLLVEIARAARARDVIVLTAEGGARGPWGGVGALTRQLVQLLGRGARTCLQHEDGIRHLLGEHDTEPRRDVHARAMLSGEGCDPLTSSCTAALTDLVRIAFRETPGLLLLDDEEHLPTAARQVWRSTGQFVQVINGGGGVLRALLVSASTASYPAELGADRVTVEMRPWRQRDLDKFLARAFASPGGARDASLAIHRITGGRPGDVVGYLRELERAGALHREGLRWRLGAPLSNLPSLAGDVADRVRRSLDAVGREASGLVESLAVARDIPLTRSAVGELAGLHGPRLAAAADAAVRAGLLIDDGAAWRVRTDAIAHKVYAAIPSDRRRVLHREVLNLLLDAHPDPLAVPLAVPLGAPVGAPIAVRVASSASNHPTASPNPRETAAPPSTVPTSAAAPSAAAAPHSAAATSGAAECPLDAIATHARASSDPRAALWTREAISRAQSAGEWDTALRHLDDAASVLGGEFADTRARLVRAELLSSLGRLGDVIESIDGRVWSEYPSTELGLKALLLLTRAYYEAREWRQVLELDIPDTPESPEILSEVRFIRAATLRQLGRAASATRESRLALAEVSDEPSRHVKLATHEYEYQTALFAFDWGRAREALVRKLRLGAQLRNRQQVVADLAKLGNAARYLARDTKLAHAILVRGIEATRSSPNVGGPAKSALYGALGYTCATRGSPRRAYRNFGKSAFHAVQSGAATLVIAARLRLIACGVSCGHARYEDKRYIQSVSTAIDPTNSIAVLSACVDLGMCLLYYGFQDDLERLIDSTRRHCGDDRRVAVLRGFSITGMMWFGEAPQSLLGHLDARPTARGVVKAMVRTRTSDSWLGAVAYCALREEFTGDAWLARLLTRHGERLSQRSSYPGWGVASLALSMALWIPIDYDPALWKRLLQSVRRFVGPLPVALEWQRVLMESREYRRLGDWRRAEALRENAEAQLALLLNNEHGARGAQAYDRWFERLRRGGKVPEDPTPAGLGPRITSSVDRTGRRNAMPLPGRWRDAVALARTESRLVILSPHARELTLLCDELRAECDRGVTVIGDDAAPVRTTLRPGVLIALNGVNLWSVERVANVRRGLIGAGARSVRVVSLVTSPLAAFRAAGPEQRALTEVIDGRLETLDPVCTERDARVGILEAMLLRASGAKGIETAALHRLAEYEWPGGVAEIERVIDAILGISPREIRNSDLDEFGWQERIASGRAELPREEQRIMELLRERTEAGISQIAEAIGKPLRTTLRAVGRLLAAERIERTGRGRATRYRRRE